MSELARIKLEGMIGIQLTPFNDDGEVDEKSYGRLVKYMLDNGVRGIITMGAISESASMTQSERKRVCELTVAETKGKVPVIQGIITESTHVAVELAKDAEDAGATGLLLPYKGRGLTALSAVNEESMYNHFYTVANAVPDLDIMLYDSPGWGVIPVPVIRRLVDDCSNVRYVKEQVDVTKVTVIINALGDEVGVFCGTDTFSVPWLQLGCVGGTHSCPNVIPMHVRKIYEAALRKDWDAVNENWFKCWPVIYAFYGQGIRPYKHALYWLGIFDNPRFLDPEAKPSEEALNYTRRALEGLGMKLIR